MLGIAAFAIGLSLALGWAHAREAQGPEAGATVAVWLGDRDAQRVFGLDRRLLVVRSTALRAPIEVEARSDGGAWIVSALDGDPLGRHQLVRLDAVGAVLARAPLGPILDLATDGQDRALVVDEGPAGRRVALYGAAAQLLWERAWPAAACAAAAGPEVLVGGASGGLARFDLTAPAALPLSVPWGAAVADVAVGPTPGAWWALDAGGAKRLALLDAGLAERWSRATQLAALHLAPVAGEERVWVADSTAPHARRFGPGGALEIDRSDLPLGGLDRAAALANGAVLLPAPGALLALDALGQNAPGQGGFDFLVDVGIVP